MGSGWCNICGWAGEFRQPEKGREGHLCGNCASSSRTRAVIYWLGRLRGVEQIALHEWPAAPSTAILESSPRGSYSMMLEEKFNYFGTEFDTAAIAAGSDPRRYADFQRLHYDDATFDVIIASDVFEHVRDDAAGFREVFRTLKPSGSLILTVPYTHERVATITRVDTSGPEDVQLLEPEYHGGGGHTLTYRTYGRDLLTLLHATGFSVMHSRTDVASLGIVPQSVIVAQKSDFIELPRPEPVAGTMRPIGPLLPYRVFMLLKYNMQGFTRFLKQIGRS